MKPDELKHLLADLYLAREEELKEYFHRSLSFQDAMFDRWERARRLGFGEGASIYNSSQVFGDVSVGRHTWIGPYTILDASKSSLSIGEYCSIAAGTHIYTHDSVEWALTGGKAEAKIGPVAIGNCCYIGSQVVIAAGVTIGDQCVVGANSFVNDSVPARAIVAGSPAKIIGHVEVSGDRAKLIFLQDDG